MKKFGAGVSGVILVRGQRGHLRLQPNPDQHIPHIEQRQYQCGQESPFEQIADGHVGGQPVNNQDDTRRQHGAQRPTGTGGAYRQLAVVTQAQHLGQRQDAQQNRLAADHTGHGGQDHRHHQGLEGNTTAQLAAKTGHSIKQVPGNAGMIQ